MTNILDLFEVRIGKEGTATSDWGTAVAQTHKVMGITDFSITPLVESVIVKDRRGSLAPGYDATFVRKSATGTLTGILNYEYLPHWLDSLMGVATPTVDTEYTYAYTAPLGTAPTAQPFTMAYGNDDDVETVKSLLGAVASSLTIRGSGSSPIEYVVNFIGKSVDTDTFDSAAEADSTVTIAKTCDLQLWIDPSSDAAGTTEILTSWMDFELSINTNRNIYYYLNQDSAGNWREARWDTSLRLGLEINSTTSALVDAVLATTSTVFERVIRIKASNGLNFITFDFNGATEEAPQLYVDKDGVVSMDLMFKGKYHSTLGNYLTASVVNTIASMP